VYYNNAKLFSSIKIQIELGIFNVINLMRQVGNSLLGVGQIGRQSVHAPNSARRAGGKSKPLFALLSAKIKHKQPPKAAELLSPSLEFLSNHSRESLPRYLAISLALITGSSCALFIALIQAECLTMTKVRSTVSVTTPPTLSPSLSLSRFGPS